VQLACTLMTAHTYTAHPDPEACRLDKKHSSPKGLLHEHAAAVPHKGLQVQVGCGRHTSPAAERGGPGQTRSAKPYDLWCAAQQQQQQHRAGTHRQPSSRHSRLQGAGHRAAQMYP